MCPFRGVRLGQSVKWGLKVRKQVLFGESWEKVTFFIIAFRDLRTLDIDYHGNPITKLLESIITIVLYEAPTTANLKEGEGIVSRVLGCVIKRQ